MEAPVGLGGKEEERTYLYSLSILEFLDASLINIAGALHEGIKAFFWEEAFFWPAFSEMPVRLNKQTQCYARKKTANLFLSVVLFPLEVPAVRNQKMISIILLRHVIRRCFCFPKCSCGLHAAVLTGLRQSSFLISISEVFFPSYHLLLLFSPVISENTLGSLELTKEKYSHWWMPAVVFIARRTKTQKGSAAKTASVTTCSPGSREYTLSCWVSWHSSLLLAKGEAWIGVAGVEQAATWRAGPER